jgi:hypothetical protein
VGESGSQRRLESHQPKALSLLRSKSFNHVHKNKQKPSAASSRQNLAMQGTAKAAHDLFVRRMIIY